MTPPRVGLFYFISILTTIFRTSNFGTEQFEWLKQEIKEAASSTEIEGVLIIVGYPWYSKREWNKNSTFYQKEELAFLIEKLGYNTNKTNKFLAMISGDTHMLTYDTGFMNKFGKFPIF